MSDTTTKRSHRHHFLGLAANLGAKEIWRHTFAIGTSADRDRLRTFLEQKYKGIAILTQNGRSGLAIALRTLLKPGDGVLVNGFTCYAVYEAIAAAGMQPIWADIAARDLNFTVATLEKALKRDSKIKAKAIIVQNTLGNPVEMAQIERFARKHDLIIIEDLAHAVGTHYADGREVGNVGAATVLSFGKDKAIDTTMGGAVILRHAAPARSAKFAMLGASRRRPRASDVLRARFYPLLGAICRGLSYLHLSGCAMRLLLKIHWVEKSADSRLDLRANIAKFEAKLALAQLKTLPPQGRKPRRTFCLVRDRAAVLKQLHEVGCYFDGLWYETPVAPERYYAKVSFPEAACPVATAVARTIVNVPTYYQAQELLPARRILAKARLTKHQDAKGSASAQRKSSASTLVGDKTQSAIKRKRGRS